MMHRRRHGHMDSDKLSVAMLGHKRVPSREGGVEIVVSELSSRMAALGHEIVCYNRRGRRVGRTGQDGAHVREFSGVTVKDVFTIDKKGLAAMTASVSASVRAAFGRYDAVHFHAEGPCAMLWLPKLLGKRCIATIHGLDHKRAKWGRFASWYIRTGERCAVRFADEIIVLSESVKRYFMETYGRECTFIPNGVSRPEHAEAKLIREKYGLGQDSYILYLGRLVPEKGIKYLIEAYSALNTDKKLVIAGGSSDTDEFASELFKMAENDPRVIFTGFVEGLELAELYSNAYLYTLPSDLEGMPLSLLEAMSFGRCVLTSDISECTEVTDGVGFSFRAGDVRDLREKLQSLCDSPEQVAQYGKRASEHVLSRYDWDDVTKRTLELYRGKTN